MSTDNMLNLRRTETEDWLLTEFYCNALEKERDLTDAAVTHRQSLWPFLEPYFSPLNPIYTPSFQTLCEKGLAPLTERHLPVWMLRDGTIPLIWFFGKTDPSTVEGQILVHADLATLVPETWAEKVALYRHVSLEKQTPESLLIVAPVHERIMDLDELDAKLAQLQEQFGKKQLRQMPVKLHAPIRGDSEDFPARFFQKIYSTFDRVTFLDWYKLENMGSLRSTALVELNAGWIFKDSYVQHHALSRGACLLGGEPGKKTAPVALSRYHGVQIEKFSFKKNPPVSPERARHLANYYSQASGFWNDQPTLAPWPMSFEKTCRAIHGKKKT